MNTYITHFTTKEMVRKIFKNDVLLTQVLLEYGADPNAALEENSSRYIGRREFFTVSNQSRFPHNTQ